MGFLPTLSVMGILYHCASLNTVISPELNRSSRLLHRNGKEAKAQSGNLIIITKIFGGHKKRKKKCDDNQMLENDSLKPAD